MSEAKIIQLSNYQPDQSPEEKLRIFQRTPILYKRILSFSIDITMIAFIKFIFTMAYASFVKTFFYQLSLETQIELIASLDLFGRVSALMIFTAYFNFSHFLGEGKTIGKILTGTTVVSNRFLKNIEQKDYRPSMPESFLRTTGYLTSYITLGALFAPALIRQDGKAWPDFISKTVTLHDDDLHKILVLKSKTEEVAEIDIDELAAA